MAIFTMVFGYAVRVLPLIPNNAWVAADDPYWHFLGLSFSPCGAAARVLCAHGIRAKLVIQGYNCFFFN